MAKGGFKLAEPIVRAHEGGYVNRPLSEDPGGPTKNGVTQKTYDGYRASKGLPLRSVAEITGPETSAIYKVQYWDAVKGDDLPAGLDYACFDFAINSGAGQAVKELQRVVKAGVDGRNGLQTIQAVCAAAAADEEAVIVAFQARRLAFMKKLKNWAANKNGWARRVQEVQDLALRIARSDLTYPIPKAELPASVDAAKAMPSETAVLKTESGKGALVTTSGVATAGVGGIAQLAGAGRQIGDGADQVSTTATSVQSATEAVGGVLHLDFRVLLMMGVALAVAGLIYLLFQLTQTQREKV